MNHNHPFCMCFRGMDTAALSSSTITARWVTCFFFFLACTHRRSIGAAWALMQLCCILCWEHSRFFPAAPHPGGPVSPVLAVRAAAELSTVPLHHQRDSPRCCRPRSSPATVKQREPAHEDKQLMHQNICLGPDANVKTRSTRTPSQLQPLKGGEKRLSRCCLYICLHIHTKKLYKDSSWIMK